MNQEAFQKLKAKSLDKGDAISIAEIAGIMGAKHTPNLVHYFIYNLSDTLLSLNSSRLCEDPI